MTSPQSVIDPTNPIRSTSDVETAPIDNSERAFQIAQDEFPTFVDIAVTMQQSLELSEMADIRFTGLFDNIRQEFQAAAQRYDDQHPEVKRHMPPGGTALPNWQLTIGIDFDESMVMTIEDVHDVITETVAGEQPEPGAAAFQGIQSALDHRPIIESAEIGALHHAYQTESGELEDYCSYMSEDLLSHDTCIQVGDMDLNASEYGAFLLHDLTTDEFRAVLQGVIDQRIEFITQARIQGNEEPMNTVIGEFLHCIDDYHRIHSDGL